MNQDQAADACFWQESLKRRIFLGDDAFVDRMQAMSHPLKMSDRAIPKQQRKRTPRTWLQALAACDQGRNRAIAWAYASGGMTMTALARNVGISDAHVSRIVAAGERREVKGEPWRPASDPKHHGASR